MAVDRSRGTTPLDRLKAQYDRDLQCRECGYEDTDGAWQARTTGDRVSYRHVCPSCGAVETRTLRFGTATDAELGEDSGPDDAEDGRHRAR